MIINNNNGNFEWVMGVDKLEEVKKEKILIMGEDKFTTFKCLFL